MPVAPSPTAGRGKDKFARGDSPTGDRPRKSNWRWVGRGFLALLVIIIIAVIWAWSYVSSIMGVTYDQDILTLVPSEMAVVVEMRHLADPAGDDVPRLTYVADILDRVTMGRAYRRALQTRVAAKFTGYDGPVDDFGCPRGQVDSPDEGIREALAQVDDIKVPVGDSLFGPLDLEEDLLGSELVVGFRNLDGAMPREVPAINPDTWMGDPADIPTDTEYPDKAFFLMTRVSGKIKLYLNFDDKANEYAGAEMDNAGVTLEHAEEGYRILTVLDSAEGPQQAFYHLIGDVFVATNSETLMQEVIALATGEGDGVLESLAASTRYEDTRAGMIEAQQAMKVQDPENLYAGAALVYVDVSVLRLCAPVDNLQRFPEEMRQGQTAGMVLPLVEDILQTVVDLRSYETAMAIPYFSEDGTHTFAGADVVLLADQGILPEIVRQTYRQEAVSAGSLGFVTADSLGILTLRETPQALDSHLNAQLQKRQEEGQADLDALLVEAYAQVVPFVDAEVAVIARPQQLSGGGSAFMPLIGIITKLNAQGLAYHQQNLDAHGGLTRLVFEQILSDRAPGTVTDEQLQAMGRNLYQVERYISEASGRVIPLIHVVRLDEHGNNVLPGLVSHYLGPEVDPAGAVVDGYLLASTSKDYLETMIDTYFAGTSRLSLSGIPGDLAALERQFPEVGTLWGRLDVDAVRDRFLTDQNLGNYADERFDLITPPPSMQMAWRQWADSFANGDAARADQFYQQREDQWRDQQRAEREAFLARMRDRRTFLELVEQAGIQMVPLPDRANGVAFRLVTSLHTR